MTASPTPTTLETEETTETAWLIQHESIDYWISSAPFDSFEKAWDHLINEERRQFPSLTFRIIKRTVIKKMETVYQ